MYEAALLTRCYTQHALRPYIDSEINHIRHFIKMTFINKGIEFIDLLSIFRDNSVTSSSPTYFENTEYPYEPDHEKTCFIPYANNKGSDQHAHPHILISAFVVRCLDSINLSSLYDCNFKPVASFCIWAGWFASDQVTNSRRHIFSWRCSNITNLSVILYLILIN